MLKEKLLLTQLQSAIARINILSFMKNLLATLATIFFINAANAADIYKIDKNHASASWQASHFGFSAPSGKFTDIDGIIIIDEFSPQNSSVDIVIKTSSISTGLSKFDNHLKSADFFNTGKFPTIKFTSSAITPRSKKAGKIKGNLTILNKTKLVTLDVKLNKKGLNPINQRKTAGFSASTTIKRSDFGMNFGLPGISNKVKINIELEANFVSSQDKNSTESIDETIPSWRIIPSTSSLQFTASQNKSNISGSFKKFSGAINFNKNQLSKSNVEIDIDTSSVAISFEEAVSTLKNPTWLSVNIFPKATFKASKFTALSDKNAFRANGTLTLKGKTVKIPVYFTLEEYSLTKARAVGKATIKRSLFKIGGKQSIRKSDNIDDKVEINFIINAEKNIF